MQLLASLALIFAASAAFAQVDTTTNPCATVRCAGQCFNVKGVDGVVLPFCLPTDSTNVCGVYSKEICPNNLICSVTSFETNEVACLGPCAAVRCGSGPCFNVRNNTADYTAFCSPRSDTTPGNVCARGVCGNLQCSVEGDSFVSCVDPCIFSTCPRNTRCVPRNGQAQCLPLPTPTPTRSARPSVSRSARPSVSRSARPSVSRSPRPSVSRSPRPSVSRSPLPRRSPTPTPSPACFVNIQGNTCCKDSADIFCPAVFDPVCDAQGNQWGNSCEASRVCATATKALCSPAPTPSPACFVNIQGNTCCKDSADIFCPAVFDPVCDAQGNQWGNSCEASRVCATATKALCNRPSPSPSASPVSCFLNKQGKSCCKPPTFCTLQFDPVCDAAGNFWSNACAAAADCASGAEKALCAGIF